MFDSCSRVPHSRRGRLPFSAALKTSTPPSRLPLTHSSCTQRIIGAAYRKHSGPSHNYRVRSLTLKNICKFIPISLQKESRGDDGNRRADACELFFFSRSRCVCVFLLILADVVRNFSSLAAGHRSGTNRGDLRWRKILLPPCCSRATFAVGHADCCFSTTSLPPGPPL